MAGCAAITVETGADPGGGADGRGAGISEGDGAGAEEDGGGMAPRSVPPAPPVPAVSLTVGRVPS